MSDQTDETTIRFDQAMARAAAGMLPPVVTGTLRTRYRQLPVMLRTSGLAATLAYLVGKTDEKELGIAYGLVASGIRKHLTDHHIVGPAPAGTPLQANMWLLTKLGELPTAGYARAAAQVEALAGWLSRLADARFQADKAAAAVRDGQP